MAVIISHMPPASAGGSGGGGGEGILVYSLKSRLLEVFWVPLQVAEQVGISDEDTDVWASCALRYWAVYFDGPSVLFQYSMLDDRTLYVYFQGYQIPLFKPDSVSSARGHVRNVVQLLSMGV